MCYDLFVVNHNTYIVIAIILSLLKGPYFDTQECIMAMSKPKRVLVSCKHQVDDSLGLSSDTIKETTQSWNRIQNYGVLMAGNTLFTRYKV